MRMRRGCWGKFSDILLLGRKELFTSVLFFFCGSEFSGVYSVRRTITTYRSVLMASWFMPQIYIVDLMSQLRLDYFSCI